MATNDRPTPLGNPGQQPILLVDHYTDSRFANLRLTEERALQRVLNELPVVAFVYDMVNNRVLFVNDSGARSLGYVPGEIEQMGPRWSASLLEARQTDFLNAGLFADQQQGGTLKVRAKLCCKDGVKVPMTLALKALAPTASHQINWVLGVAEPSSRRRTALAESDSISSSQPKPKTSVTAFWEFDVQANRMTYLSPEIEELTGYERSRWSATGHQFPTAGMAEYERISCAFKSASASKKVFRLEVDFRSAGGKTARILLKGSMRDERRLCGSVEHVACRNSLPSTSNSMVHGSAQKLQSIYQAVEEEKVSTAQFLHDEVGQCATAILLELSCMREDAESAEAAEQQAALADISQRLTKLIDAIRLRSRQLMPPSLECGDLRTALRKECADFQRHTGILCHVRYHISQDEKWLEEEKMALFRIAQEALNNVRKHANACAVSITVMNASGALRLRIKDNGKGLSTDRNASEGIGIASMRQRARSIGCNLFLRNLPGGGTELLMERELRS